MSFKFLQCGTHFCPISLSCFFLFILFLFTLFFSRSFFSPVLCFFYLSSLVSFFVSFSFFVSSSLYLPFFLQTSFVLELHNYHYNTPHSPPSFPTGSLSLVHEQEGVRPGPVLGQMEGVRGDAQLERVVQLVEVAA